MDGFQANDAGDLAVSHQHLLAQQHPAVHAAHADEFQIPVLRDGADHESHLVHVGTEHQLSSGGLCALFEANQIAHSVHIHGVHIGGDLFFDVISYGVLKGGHTGEGTQLFQQIHHTCAPSSPSFRVKAANS